ncbi:fimbrial assembly protein [Euhalothece natronophila Z-M001]|uniref:Fimbrial assembly protein n=1 Tax=Euhalothece natronophila Z-M001 TaxID=522448 RepID=A0A5B8NKT2_9CHRO|nr:PilN domain-containing protein [Euhalothece natronophila]QDZ38890.1 fimbrial assembly protein [Euhalothece natronophila Z-M001]
MYSLDVNFLRERKQEAKPRKETQTQRQTFTPQGGGEDDKLPLIVGAIVGVALPAMVFGYQLIISQQIEGVEEDVSDLEQELGQLEGQQEEINQKEEELEEAEDNLTALADIFNTIKPMSAVLQDVRDRAPGNIQINSLQEGEQDSFDVEGIGESFEAVNYFVLTLKRSPFIEQESVNLQTASRTDFSVEIEELPQDVEEVSAARVISYTISFQLNDEPASELIANFEEKGATGLVTRIRTLQERGIIE